LLLCPARTRAGENIGRALRNAFDERAIGADDDGVAVKRYRGTEVLEQSAIVGDELGGLFPARVVGEHVGRALCGIAVDGRRKRTDDERIALELGAIAELLAAGAIVGGNFLRLGPYAAGVLEHVRRAFETGVAICSDHGDAAFNRNGGAEVAVRGAVGRRDFLFVQPGECVADQRICRVREGT